MRHLRLLPLFGIDGCGGAFMVDHQEILLDAVVGARALQLLQVIECWILEELVDVLQPFEPQTLAHDTR
jgi:hypothetical protein